MLALRRRLRILRGQTTLHSLSKLGHEDNSFGFVLYYYNVFAPHRRLHLEVRKRQSKRNIFNKQYLLPKN